MRKQIEENRRLQKAAKTLNIRAGEMVFDIMTPSLWREWLTDKVKGATCAKDLNANAINLPKLDTLLVRMVLKDNPKTIKIAGMKFSVIYMEGKTPQMRLTAEQLMKVADTQINLPGGRTIEVRVNNHVGVDISKVKEDVHNGINYDAWLNWKRNHEEEEEATPTNTIPNIISDTYGICAATQLPLPCYGTMTVRKYYDGAQLTWEHRWYRSKEKALEANDASKECLQKHIEEETIREVLLEAKKRMEEVTDEVYVMYRKEICPSHIQGRLQDIVYACKPTTLKEVEARMFRAKEVLHDAKTYIKEAEEVKCGIPEEVLHAFNGNKVHAYSFVKKVSEINVNSLDEHIISNCGRSRVHDHIIEITNDDMFFMGADPNNVKHYIARVCLHGEGVVKKEKEEEDTEVSATPNTIEALRNKFNTGR